jgi:hypothetical protein
MMFWHGLTAVSLTAQAVAAPEPGAQWIDLDDVLRLSAAVAVSAVFGSLFWRSHGIGIAIVLTVAALSYWLLQLLFPSP